MVNHENLKNMSDNQILTVNEVARAYNKSARRFIEISRLASYQGKIAD
jgi:hypothetical protein